MREILPWRNFIGFPKLCGDFPAKIIVKHLCWDQVVFFQLGIYLVMLNCNSSQRWHSIQLLYESIMRHKQSVYFLLFLFKGHFLCFCSSRLSYNPLKKLTQGALKHLGGFWLGLLSRTRGLLWVLVLSRDPTTAGVLKQGPLWCL